LELLLLEIVVEKKWHKDKRREREKKGAQKLFS
jgi:hypothetical protein